MPLYKYRPKTKEELIEAIKKEIYKVQGTKDNPNWQADLNRIDTGSITDMNGLFSNEYNLNKFNGDISNWNTKNVKNMSWMFAYSQFNGDISNWDVGNVKNIAGMFLNSEFNQDISNWDVGNVKDMSWMFYKSKFNGDISKWNVSNVENMEGMFSNSEFNKDISKWNISNVKYMSHMFESSYFNGNISNWNVNNIKYMSWMFQNSKFNGDTGSWPLKKRTCLENISVSLEYSKLPDKIIYPETVANIFIRSINNSDNIFNTDSFKQIFKDFLNNRKKLYKNKGYKPEIINKLILNDIADILKHIKEKKIQKRFMEITMNKNGKELMNDIN